MKHVNKFIVDQNVSITFDKDYEYVIEAEFQLSDIADLQRQFMLYYRNHSYIDQWTVKCVNEFTKLLKEALVPVTIKENDIAALSNELKRYIHTNNTAALVMTYKEVPEYARSTVQFNKVATSNLYNINIPEYAYVVHNKIVGAIHYKRSIERSYSYVATHHTFALKQPYVDSYKEQVAEAVREMSTLNNAPAAETITELNRFAGQIVWRVSEVKFGSNSPLFTKNFTAAQFLLSSSKEDYNWLTGLFGYKYILPIKVNALNKLPPLEIAKLSTAAYIKSKSTWFTDWRKSEERDIKIESE